MVVRKVEKRGGGWGKGTAGGRGRRRLLLRRTAGVYRWTMGVCAGALADQKGHRGSSGPAYGDGGAPPRLACRKDVSLENIEGEGRMRVE